ncbi:hypothetical protein ACFWR9_08870 [Streptomyces sp. NPDC058534]|uniref:hypothetical protein n=1 Tax=Streptomyces sp. NPDC058534 TaxID=3346541 RepID=UPI003669179A
MTHTPPPMPDFPPPPAPAPKKSRTNLIIIGSAVAIIAAIIGTGVVVVQNQDDDKPAATATASSTPPEEEIEPAVEESEPDYVTPLAGDFTADLRTVRRKCFGSAGCNVTVEPKLAYNGASASLDPAAVFEITYEIRGGGDGPVIETAELTDQTTLNFTQTMVSGVPASGKLSVEITEILERGY